MLHLLFDLLSQVLSQSFIPICETKSLLQWLYHQPSESSTAPTLSILFRVHYFHFSPFRLPFFSPNICIVTSSNKAIFIPTQLSAGLVTEGDNSRAFSLSLNICLHNTIGDYMSRDIRRWFRHQQQLVKLTGQLFRQSSSSASPSTWMKRLLSSRRSLEPIGW